MTKPRGDRFASDFDDEVASALLSLRATLATRGHAALSLIHSERAHPPTAWASAGVLGVDALVRSGLLIRERGLGVRAGLRIDRSAGLWIVHDHPHASESPVMGVGLMSTVLAAFTPRHRCETALDVGTGQGFHAILASRHAARVIGTDMDARSLHCAQLTMALNGSPAIELRLGSLFEPSRDLAGLCDLVVSNPPQLVSPAHVTRAGDLASEGNDFVATMVGEAPGMLRDGGYFACTAIWGHDREASWSSAPRAWTQAKGCDVWVVRLRCDPAHDYARMWRGAIAERRGGDMSAQGLERWLVHASSHGVSAVSTGLIFLHKRRGENWFHGQPADLVGITDGATPESSLLLARVFANRTRLHEADRASAAGLEPLLEARCVRAAGVDELSRTPRGWVVRHRTGLSMERPGTPIVHAILASADGTRTLRETLDRIRPPAGAHTVAAGSPEHADPESPLEAARDLLERGMLEAA